MILASLADALVASLNAHKFSKPFTAVRAYRPIYKLEDMDVLHVTVVPKGASAEFGTRADDRREIQLDVAVQQRTANDSTAVLDPLLALAEEIADYCRRLRPADFPAAICLRVEHAPIYAPEHIETMATFTSVLTLTFLVLQ